jgi:hypothetical protein
MTDALPSAEPPPRSRWRSWLLLLLPPAAIIIVVGILLVHLISIVATARSLDNDIWRTEPTANTQSISIRRQALDDQLFRASVLVIAGSIGAIICLTMQVFLVRRALEGAGESDGQSRLFLDLAEAIPQLVWITDGAGRPIYFNGLRTGFIGATPEQFNDPGWEYALHPDDRAATFAKWNQSLRTFAPFEAEYRLRRCSDGAYCWFLCRATPIPDKSGRNVHWFGTCTDIESQKQLARKHEELLAAERAARAELFRAGMIKDRFLATLSHELRTPMTAILGWAQLLHDPAVREKNLDRAIEAIGNNARAQGRLIEDLLDMGRILSGKMALRPQSVDLRQVVKSAIDAVGPGASAKRVNLTHEIEPEGNLTIVGDPARLQQIVTNLLSNALKFTPADGTVAISLHQERGSAVIAVSDSGRGIAPDFLPHVFERFAQGENPGTRQSGGLGLGLAISRHLVELHGGIITAASDGEGRGATFTVEIPLNTSLGADPAIKTTAAAPSQGVSLAGLRLLVVDDDYDTAQVLRTVLERAGAAVELAYRGDEALARLHGRDFDLLISDVAMPEMDGYELIRRLREEAGARPIHAIAVSAFADLDHHKQSLAAGYEMHISKPVLPDALIRAVAAVVGCGGER